MKKNIKTLLITSILSAGMLVGCSSTIEAPYINSEGYWVVNGEVTDVLATGTKGETGATGEKGDKGDKGDTGAKGDTGDTGAKGDKGDTGATGVAGATGEKGDKGDTGAAGEDGNDAPHYGEVHTVTFDVNGGTLPYGVSTSLEVDYGDTITLPVPTKSGYTFLGWFTGDTVNDGQFFNYSPVCSDLNLIARWKEITYTMPDTVNVVSGAKDVYSYGDVVTIEPKNVAGKVFAKFTASMEYGGTTYTSAYSYTFTVGHVYDPVVHYIDEVETADGTEGTYLYSDDDVSFEIMLDGKGSYIFNDEMWACAIATNMPGVFTTWTPGVTENLTFETTQYTLYNCSIVLDEEFPDGNTYSYIEVTFDIDTEKTVKLWLDGVGYEEVGDFPFAGTYTGETNDEEMLELYIGPHGQGTLKVDGSEYTTITVVSYDETSFTTRDENDTEETITIIDGVISGRVSDYRCYSFTYEAYVFPFFGVFNGSYNDDEGTPIDTKITVSKDGKTATYYEDGTEYATFTITEFDYPSYLTLTDEYDESYTIRLNEETLMYRAKLNGENSCNYSFTQYTKCAFAGTYNATDSDESEYVMTIKDDYTGTLFIDGSLYFSFKVEDVTDTSFTLVPDNGDDSVIATINESGVISMRLDYSLRFTKTA